MKNKFVSKKTVLILACIAIALLLVVLYLLLAPLFRGPEIPDSPLTTPTELTGTTEPTVTDDPLATTEPVVTDPQMLPHMAEIYAKNQDVVGWVKIDRTKLDYPVMHTPEDPEKYIHLNFEQRYTYGGLPFLQGDCYMDPESDNLIIYGHNMNDGSMFATLMYYTEQEYWKLHPQVQFSTLYEDRTYDIVAAFYDRVYYNYEDVFKFYQFIEVEDEDAFNEAMAYYKEHSLYDTGVTAEYGDRLLTLVTCAYHHQYGRFVVVARQSMDQPDEVTTP